MSARHARQVQMLVALVRSLRRVELCHRDFVVLLGTQVPLSTEHQHTLLDVGVLLRAIPPIIPGVPTADKLHVWTMTNYSQCVVLDADLMVLKPIDGLFGGPAELTIAHHPYDHLQAQCGVPVAARGIAAMIVVRPNIETYFALIRYLWRRFKAEQLLYSDQTGLMCFFGNRTHTLPCPYLYDVSMMTESFLPRWIRNCRTFVRQHVMKNCLHDIEDGCRSLAGRRVCDETQLHVQEHCVWSVVSSQAHAVHFKGSTKPWRRELSSECQLLRHGMPGVRPSHSWPVALAPTQALYWNTSWQWPDSARPGACMSVRWRLPVFWSRPGDEPIRTRKCCTQQMLMAAQWYELLK